MEIPQPTPSPTPLSNNQTVIYLLLIFGVLSITILGVLISNNPDYLNQYLSSNFSTKPESNQLNPNSQTPTDSNERPPSQEITPNQIHINNDATLPLTQPSPITETKIIDTGWKNYNGHQYRRIWTDTQNWEYSNQLCQSFDSHLATITSQLENEFLSVLCGENNICRLGHQSTNGYCSPDPGNWITGEKFSYTDWKPGEPEYACAEDCLDINPTFDSYKTWNNEWCDNYWQYGKYAICERDEFKVLTPTITPTPTKIYIQPIYQESKTPIILKTTPTPYIPLNDSLEQFPETNY